MFFSQELDAKSAQISSVLETKNISSNNSHSINYENYSLTSVDKEASITNKKSIRGMITYTLDGDITEDPRILLDGKDFFRKMTDSKEEKEICELLMKNPHKNIIKIYNVTNNYIDMELLNTNINREDISKLKNIMEEVKTYLQGIGIIYIDWKLDNTGISNDGEFKLFDFNGSGIIDIETKEWKIKPPEWWSYNNAIENGIETPVAIDNYSFKSFKNVLELNNSKSLL